MQLEYARLHRARVYQPAEDTFLLLDALSQYAASGQLRGVLTALEFGSGSGALAAAVAQLRPEVHVLAVDLNPCAAQCTAASLRLVRAGGCALLADGMRALRPRSVDFAFCNPPYVPSEPLASVSTEDRCWAGGRDGVEVAARFLAEARRVLRAPDSRVLLLLEARNRPREFLAARKNYWNYNLLAARKILGEMLSVYELAPLTVVALRPALATAAAAAEPLEPRT